jgi:hypothetical protein
MKKKKESRHRLIPSTKINSKWVIDLNIKYKTMKQEDGIVENLNDLGFDDLVIIIIGITHERKQ